MINRRDQLNRLEAQIKELQVKRDRVLVAIMLREASESLFAELALRAAGTLRRRGPDKKKRKHRATTTKAPEGNE